MTFFRDVAILSALLTEDLSLPEIVASNKDYLLDQSPGTCLSQMLSTGLSSVVILQKPTKSFLRDPAYKPVFVSVSVLNNRLELLWENITCFIFRSRDIFWLNYVDCLWYFFVEFFFFQELPKKCNEHKLETISDLPNDFCKNMMIFFKPKKNIKKCQEKLQ